MSAPAWESVKTELAQLLELDEEARAAVLAKLRARDEGLADEVESLLVASASTGFLETPASARAVGTMAAAVPEAPPARVGPWRVEEEIGRGGMGSVHRGRRDDGAYEQVVAIKLIRPELASELLRRRFLAERRILAALDHPNIARVLDAGSTEEGAPYLVLEHVAGEPIDRYCDARSLDVAARLRLFVKVCAAVHHAHQQLVLHRDIKGANILVDGRGEPKLLDFGIAKLLTLEPTVSPAESELTTLGSARPLTPEWASPEQLRGDPLTTASDLYSLGVLFFVLLAGERPHKYDGRSVESFAERVEAEGPPPLAAWARRSAPGSETARKGAPLGVDPRRLAGDLEAIAGKALDPDPRRRYGTALELATEVERYLDGHPVAARTPSPAYRLRKWLARHRAAAVTTAVVAVALLAATVVSVRQAGIAERERKRAEKRFDDVRRLANVVLFDVNDALVGVSGAMKARQMLVENAQRYLDDLASEARNEPALQLELATAYERIGELQGMPNWPSAGKSGDSLVSFERALALRKSIDAERTPDPGNAKRAHAQTLIRIGDVLAGRGETSRARESHLAAGTMLAERLAAAPTPDLRRQIAVVEVAVGDDSWELGDMAGAVEAYERGLAQSTASRRDEPDSRVSLRQIGVIHQRLGDAEAEQNAWDRALVHYRASLAIDEELARLEPDNFEAQRDLGIDHARMGSTAFAGRDYEAALDSHRLAAEIREKILEAEPGDTRALTDAAETSFHVAQSLYAGGRKAEARAPAAKAIERWRALARIDPENARWLDSLAHGLAGRARWDANGGRRDLAAAALEEAVSIRTGLEARNPGFAKNAASLAEVRKLLDDVRSGAPVSDDPVLFDPWQ